MQIHILTLPLLPDPSQIEELNHFLRSHKIIDVRKELAQSAGNACWTFCITYVQDQQSLNSNKSSKERIDYKEVLDEKSFNIFSLMRKVRKELADKDAVPAYAVFTDAELAEMAKAEQPVGLDLMASIPGIGKKKIEKYGSAFCSLMETIENETNGTSDR